MFAPILNFIFAYIAFLNNYTLNMHNKTHNQQNYKGRVGLSIRPLEISSFHYEKSRAKNVKSIMEFFVKGQRSKQSALNDLQNSVVIIKYEFEGREYEIMGAWIELDYLASVVSSSHSSYFVGKGCNLQIESLNSRKEVINVTNIYRIDATQIYKQLPYDFILIQIKNGRSGQCLGYDFRPLPYQEKRIKLMRVNKKQQIKKLYLYDQKQLVPLSIYPFLDLQYNFVMQNSELNHINCGSPIVQEIEYQFCLVGFYCARCLVPIEDYHYIYLLNGRILQKIKSIQVIKGEKAALSKTKLYKDATLKAGRLTSLQMDSLTTWKFDNLLVLELNSNRIGRKGVKKLVRANWHQIRNISLDGNEIDNSCLSYLSRTNWKQFISISVINNVMGNQGAVSFGKCCWKQISYINLYKNNLNQVGVLQFLRFDCPFLALLNIQKSKSGKEVLKMERYFSSKMSKLQKFSI